MSKSSTGNVSSQLSISSVTWGDEGVYTCVAVELGPGTEQGQRVPVKQNILLDVLGKFL